MRREHVGLRTDVAHVTSSFGSELSVVQRAVELQLGSGAVPQLRRFVLVPRLASRLKETFTKPQTTEKQPDRRVGCTPSKRLSLPKKASDTAASRPVGWRRLSTYVRAKLRRKMFAVEQATAQVASSKSVGMMSWMCAPSVAITDRIWECGF